MVTRQTILPTVRGRGCQQGEIPAVRGGQDWDIGNFRVNGSLGLNLLDFDDDGLSDLVSRIAAFQIFGLGVHYVF